MMEKNNKFWYAIGDHAILQKIGTFIQQTRLEQNKTQEQLAKAAGINRSTLVLVENGRGGTLPTLIAILRALEKLDLFQNFEFTQQVSPITLAILERNKRQRAGNKKQTGIPKSKSVWW